MLKIKILEGPRGVGKSTVARLLRNSIEGSTLINLTGFKEDGQAGFDKIKEYYIALNAYLRTLHESDATYTILFDRFWFSEVVYGPQFKSYHEDFREVYEALNHDLLSVVDDIEIYFLTISSREQLRQRLVRDKVGLFGYVKESVDNSLIQQDIYEKVFDNFVDEYGDKYNFNLYKIDTTDLTPEDIKNNIIKE